MDLGTDGPDGSKWMGVKLVEVTEYYRNHMNRLICVESDYEYHSDLRLFRPMMEYAIKHTPIKESVYNIICRSEGAHITRSQAVLIGRCLINRASRLGHKQILNPKDSKEYWVRARHLYRAGGFMCFALDGFRAW